MANMRGMLFRRPFRRFVACVAAAMILACQGRAMAGASAPAQADVTATAPCHDAGSAVDKGTGGACPARCEFQNTSSAPAKLVYATADLPATTADFVRIAPVAPAAPPTGLPLARIEPPPLRILNCCLRN